MFMNEKYCQKYAISSSHINWPWHLLGVTLPHQIFDDLDLMVRSWGIGNTSFSWCILPELLSNNNNNVHLMKFKLYIYTRCLHGYDPGQEW